MKIDLSGYEAASDSRMRSAPRPGVPLPFHALSFDRNKTAKHAPSSAWPHRALQTPY